MILNIRFILSTQKNKEQRSLFYIKIEGLNIMARQSNQSNGMRASIESSIDTKFFD